MKSQDRVEAGLLYALYAPLLTEHQREVWQLYFLEDWSLAEIGESHGISRAAVHDLLERTQRLMEDYEARLGLMKSQERRRTWLTQLKVALTSILCDSEELQAAQRVLDRMAEEEGLQDV